MINVDDLRKCGNSIYDDGYRLVYFYDDTYRVGCWVSDIKNFMYEFVEVAPIESDDDIPKFISIDDILNRCIRRDEKLIKVAIYTVSGELIKEREASKEDKDE